MRARALIVAAVVLGGLWWSPAEAGSQFNCPDFQFQEDAQAQLPGNPGLDGDGDGIACQDLPSRGTAATTVPVSETPVVNQTGCHPSYQACLPIGVDLDCSEIDVVDFGVVGPDEYGLDADGDTVGCESGDSPAAAGTAEPATAVRGRVTLTG